MCRDAYSDCSVLNPHYNVLPWLANTVKVNRMEYVLEVSCQVVAGMFIKLSI